MQPGEHSEGVRGAGGPPPPPEGEGRGSMCFNYQDATENLMLPYGEGEMVQSWMILIAMAFITISITGFLIKRLDNR